MIGGAEYRRSLKTTSWPEAELIIKPLEAKASVDFAAKVAATLAIETISRSARDTPEVSRIPLGGDAGRSGAVAEMVVVVDLMDRGFEVYRPVHNTARFDAIAVIGDKFLRVEVKRASISRSGRIDCEIANHGHFDILALVTAGKVSYYAANALDPSSKRPRLFGSVQRKAGRKQYTLPAVVEPEDFVKQKPPEEAA